MHKIVFLEIPSLDFWPHFQEEIAGKFFGGTLNLVIFWASSGKNAENRFSKKRILFIAFLNKKAYIGNCLVKNYIDWYFQQFPSGNQAKNPGNLKNLEIFFK